MATVYVTSIAERVLQARDDFLWPVKEIRDSAMNDRYGVHRLADAPSSADIILFVESHHDESCTGVLFENVMRDPLYRQSPGKCFIHSGMDCVIPRMRGIFPSIERWQHAASRTRAGSYLVKKIRP